ncbi:zinc finger protein 395-like [Seriola dumerili]|uniref:zinc finger protein 395-like n=1 Tax=Seriola dumerili TaxID=41447 RepID=UPI000BBEB9C4|nr:zinc finger protein 395-like [Seriola dumerili]
MLPKTRLGKRSPLGALVSSTCPVAAGAHMHLETGEAGVTVATAAGQQASSRVKGHPGLKVYFQCGGGGESPAVADQLDLMRSDVSAWSSSHPSSVPLSSSRSVSSCIDVPRSQRSPEEVDMDELMAAMVLSSLSCSPLLHSPVTPDPTAALTDSGGSDLSDSSSSGYWSVGRTNGSPDPSPPIAEPDVSPTTPPDEGLDMELEEVFDEPAPRKRKNSVKVAYRCLWPSCGKVLTSVVGIKRHIRTTHLCRGGEHERCSRSEEDFYYTEIIQRDHHQFIIIHHHQQQQQQQQPPSPPSPTCGTLSHSAPSSSGSLLQVQSEHSYQALPPSHVISAAASSTASCRSMAPPTTCHSRQGLSFRVRSISVGEQWLQHQSAPCRRVRGEAKKCRKVYGIEHRDQWCTACRWKKACQRFLD